LDLRASLSRDVVLTKEVWRTHPITDIFKQFETHFKTKREKGAGRLFPRVPENTWFHCFTQETNQSL